MRDTQKGNKTMFGLKGDLFIYDPNTKLWSTGADNYRWNFEKGATTTQLIVKLGLSTSEFQAMKGTLPPPRKGEEEGGEPVTLYNNKKIDNNIFAKTATESYNTFNNLNIPGVIFSLETRSGVSKLIQGEETNIINVESGGNSIKIKFGLEDVKAQKAEMKRLNDFLKKYSK